MVAPQLNVLRLALSASRGWDQKAGKARQRIFLEKLELPEDTSCLSCDGKERIVSCWKAEQCKKVMGLEEKDVYVQSYMDYHIAKLGVARSL